MKNIYLLLIFVGLSMGVVALPYWAAVDYYNKGQESFRAGNYSKAASEFEYATFKADDATISMDSVRYMQQLSLYCQNHKDSGYACYEVRKYPEALRHFALVSQSNCYDKYCRDMMGICIRKNRRSAFAGMQLITPSEFNMGRKDGAVSEQPSNVVDFGPYYIDQSEVSNEDFALFLNMKGLYSKSGVSRIDINVSICHIELDQKTGWFSVEKGYEKYPVLGVTWYGANDYAQWLGKSLPTEKQWEYAFGNAQISEDAYYHNVDEGGANKYGIYGMADNGREWMADWYNEMADGGTDHTKTEIQECKSVRGARSGDDDFNPATYRDYELPNFGGTIGFRCVKNITHIR
ncbi:MAG: SUMF1/EgtB/PvdO family nonheme iron enzyme [Bacteroidales bacterium]|nr:SUMF1/EgtB/PvdO family nonheme iron enzyme [Bacteroidales bacterium]